MSCYFSLGRFLAVHEEGNGVLWHGSVVLQRRKQWRDCALSEEWKVVLKVSSSRFFSAILSFNFCWSHNPQIGFLAFLSIHPFSHTIPFTPSIHSTFTPPYLSPSFLSSFHPSSPSHSHI